MKKRMKSAVSVIAFFAVCAALPLLLCGCTGYGTELSQSMIIQGMAVDYHNGVYTVTVEMLNNLQSGSVSAESASSEKSKIFSSDGKTVSEAVRNIADKCGKMPLYAHNRVIILGAENLICGVSDALDFFERDYDTKPAALVCAAKGCTAGELLRADTGKDTVKSEVLEAVLTRGSENSRVVRVRVLDAVNAVIDEAASLALPAVTLEKNGDAESFLLDGTAVFDRNEKFAFFMGKDESAGLVYLKDKIKKGSIEAQMPDGEAVSFLIVSAKTHYDLLFDGDTPVFKVKVGISADLNEIGGVSFTSLDKSDLKNAAQAAALTVENEMSMCFALLNEKNCDAADLSKRLKVFEPELYAAFTRLDQTVVTRCRLLPEVTVTVHRVGDESFS